MHLTAVCLSMHYLHLHFIQTEPSAPPRKVSIVSTSSHSFTMTWAPPPKGQQNGEIVSYKVEYREEGSNSTVVTTTRGMRYTAEDLTTDRVYQFRVAANTVNGTGPFSEWTEVGTIPTGNGCLRLHPHPCTFPISPSLSSPHWRIIKTHVNNNLIKSPPCSPTMHP